jgi:excisionase family DNA binding protein
MLTIPTTDTTPGPELLTLAQVADLLQVSRATAWRRVNSGELPSVRAGGRVVRVLRADLVDYLAAANAETGE